MGRAAFAECRDARARVDAFELGQVGDLPLGEERVDHALALIDSMEEQLVDLYADRRRQAVDAPLLSPRTLRRLGEMDDEALNAVLTGHRFADQAAPGSHTVLSHRVEDEDTPTDTRFLYTYAGADTTTTLLVHLYQPHAGAACWILFRPT